MFCKETQAAIVGSARSLTEDNLVLVIPNETYPLAVFADGFSVDGNSNKVALSEELEASVEEFFEEANQEQPVSVEEEQEALIAHVCSSLQKIQFNTQNVICPAIEYMVRVFNERQSISCQPDVSATFYHYNAVHSDPRLTAHVSTRYNNLQPLPEYRTFILESIDANEIIRLVSMGNPHLDQTEVEEWLLSIPNSAAVIEGVWNSIFNDGRLLIPGELEYVVGRSFPFTVDSLALAYMICGHYIDNPVEVIGESDVDLETWSLTIRKLHEMFGFYLKRAYERRQADRDAGLLILASEANNVVANSRCKVIINGDVAPQFELAGGDIQAILGAAVAGSNNIYLEQILNNSEQFIQRWLSVYPLIKQSAMDKGLRKLRNDIHESFMDGVINTELKDRHVNELEYRIKEAMSTMTTEDLKNPYITFGKLICKTFFTENVYWQYLLAIDEFSQMYPEATLRELNTQSLISLMAAWLSQQIKVERFTGVVDPYAKLPVKEVIETVEDDDTETLDDVEIEEEVSN
ncbi:hypothetical protein CDGHABPJ_00337 [Pseudomonas phage OMKO1]|nr:hypothetical protein CDGHABPJ_00337 [Pseudomonas phage OMKO1]WNV47881.1 hypothetical protein [Pseudomonas phage fMGyn-Pae01]